MFKKYTVTVVGAVVACAWAHGEFPAPIEQSIPEANTAPVAMDASAPELGEGPDWRAEDNIAALITELEALENDGLDPEDYGLSAIRNIYRLHQGGKALSVGEAKILDGAFVGALRDLHLGRLSAESDGNIWYSDRVSRAPRGIIPALVATGAADISRAFTAARPTLLRYQQLRDAYRQARDKAQLGASGEQTWPRMGEGGLLSEGDSDPRVVTLKQRLRAEDYLPALPSDGRDSPEFDAALSAAVKSFQRRHSLQTDGVVGPYTLAELNVPRSQRLEQVAVNLERLRWLAVDMEPDLLLVDIAGARVELYEAGQVIWSSKTQVGKPYRKTPSLKSLITHLTLNPTWTVPPTIYRKDKLPAIRQDISYLARNRIRVLDPAGGELDPATIDWRNPGNIILRQDAGPGSALGVVAIRFPNPFSVYLHDTPNKRLFDTTSRFYSSGCVRVEGAPVLADLLFRNAGQATLERFHELWASGKTQNINVPEPLPLLMGYWTAEGDGSGNVIFRPDIYNLDKALAGKL